AVNLVSDHQLPGLVIHFDNDVFAEIFERYFAAVARAKIPDLVSPVFKIGIVRNPPFERDGFVLAATWRFTVGTGVATFTMGYNLGCALERANFADTRYVATIPFNAEFKIFIRVKASCIDAKLRHGVLPYA